MYRVQNRKTIRRLSFRTMREKGWKNLIAIAAIALTSLLFTALFTVGMSMAGSIQEATMRQVGTRAHGGYKYMRQQDYEKIKNVPGIRDISYSIMAGFAQNPELLGIQTEVCYGMEKDAEWGFCLPETGHMPKSGAECATSTKVLDALGLPHETGIEVPLSVRIGEKEVEETFLLAGYWEDTGVSIAERFWISEEWLTKHVPAPAVPYTENLLSNGGMEGYMNISVMLPSAYDIEGQMKRISLKAGLDEDVKESVNWAYLTSKPDMQGVLLSVALLTVILLSGYLIIYNIFYINVTTDIRYYGLLKTVGTTGRQLKSMVRGQALLLSAAGIPVGLLSGWLAGKGFMPMMYDVMEDVQPVKTAVTPWIFAGSAVFSLIAVYLSCIRPCRLAAGVSPVEALRFCGRENIRKKTKKPGKTTMLRIALANMGRNRKKALVVIVSLSLCLVLLNATYILVKGFDFNRYTEKYLVGDYMVKPAVYIDFSDGESYTDCVTEEMRKKVEGLPGVTSVEEVYLKDTVIYRSEKGRQHLLDFISSHEKELGNRQFWQGELDMAKENGGQYASLYGIPASMLERLKTIAGTIDADKFKTGKYVLVAERYEEDGCISPGDRVRFSENGEELEVLAVVSMPVGMGAQFYSGKLGLYVITEAGAFYDIAGGSQGANPEGGLQLTVNGEDSKEKETGEALEKLIAQNYPEFRIVSRENLREEFSKFIGIFALTGGLLCLILGLIGILNFINAVITGILTRKQEFAMMESVGMTGRQLRRMLVWEGVIYGLWTAGLSSTVGAAAGYLSVKAIGGGMDFFTWHFTVTPVLCAIPFLAFTVIAVPFVCYHAMCKRSIVERLRMTDI